MENELRRDNHSPLLVGIIGGLVFTLAQEIGLKQKEKHTQKHLQSLFFLLNIQVQPNTG